MGPTPPNNVLIPATFAPDVFAPNIFAQAPIDRHSILRGDAAWIAQAADGALYLPVGNGAVPVTGSDAAGLHLDFRGRPAGEIQPILLGLRDGAACFAYAVGVGEATAEAGFQELRAAGPLLPPQEASLAAYAVGLVRWHDRHRFCGVCGTPTEVIEAGHKRICPNPDCRAEHFPRTDPAVIVLVEHEGSCFLAHNARHRAGMHSTLAGFVEPGESLEAAVAREIMEEAAIELTRISYHSSQPWPFPASLMIGFTADAASRDFRLDGVELVEGGWFSRADLLAVRRAESDADPAISISLPNALSISRRLIEDWLAVGA